MYNFLNLPYKIIGAENDELQMLYAADGTLLQRKYIRNNIVQNKIDYISDKEYHNDTLEYIHHADGRVIKNGTAFQYEYNIKDHLGNVRATFCDVNGNGLISNSVTERRSRLDYYSFGMEHYRGAFEYTQQKNNYKYNGKEKVEEMSLGLYDYGARWYDATIGRFVSPDPLSELAPDWTPYRYGFNNPIIYTDPDGLFEDKEAAKAYAKENGIKTGFLRDNKIVKQSDGTYAIENKGEHSSTFQDKTLADEAHKDGVFTGVMVAANDVMKSETNSEKSSFLGIESNSMTGMTNTYRDGSTEFHPIDAGTIEIGPVKGIKALQALPSLDITGKAHGLLPRIKDLAKYSKGDLGRLVKELQISVRGRINATVKFGRDKAHGQRQGAEQDLIKSIEKHLQNR